MTLVSNGSGNLAGYLYLQGYYYALVGTCGASTISLSNLTTGSPYVGTWSSNGSDIYMSGTFTVTSGATYNWSASSR